MLIHLVHDMTTLNTVMCIVCMYELFGCVESRGGRTWCAIEATLSALLLISAGGHSRNMGIFNDAEAV